MAATFTATEKALIFEIFGIPPAGSSKITTELVQNSQLLGDLFYSFVTTGDHSAAVTAVAAQITAAENLDQTQYAVVKNCKELLGQYLAIRDSVLVVTQSPKGSGLIADHKAQVRLIRKRLVEILGISTLPSGGFDDSVRRSWDQSGGLGDR